MIRSLKPALVVGLLLLAACSGRPGPITVADNVVSVQNQTTRDWKNVVVTVNDHFRGGAATLAAGSRMTAHLSKFQTAFGQPFDVARQHVAKVVVTATDANGAPVEITFDPLKR
jgi:hypothetical protein